jgi:hypothetical protein
MNMNPSDIVKEYDAVLEKRLEYGVAAPLSLLPYSKAEIKSALKSAMAETDSPEERERLKNGFITLAEFIPDVVAERVNQDLKDVADAECEVSKDPEPVTRDVMAEVVEAQKGIADEGAKLLAEITAYLAQL